MSSKRKRRSKIFGMAALAAAISFYGQAQVPGCTDSLALNFNPIAEVNDGSCLFESQSVYTGTVSDPISSIVWETSGLLFHDGSLWTINDSGNPSEIYELDPTDGAILKTVTVNNVAQVDWEAMTTDGTSIYIGDFGNNSGSRTDLIVYKVPWSPITESSGDTAVAAESISFHFPDQTDFTPEYDNNDFDCEAMFFYQDSLHLFSKNWVNNWTRHYRLPTTPGSYAATLVDSFNVQGLVTDAALNLQENVAVLLGHTEDMQPFIYLLNDFREGLPFSGNKRRLSLPAHLGHKTEGIAFSDSLSLYFTREFTTDGPGLYHLELTHVLYPNGITQVSESEYDVVRANGLVRIRREDLGETCPIRIYDQMGRLLVNDVIQSDQAQLILVDPMPNAPIIVSVLDKMMVSELLPPQFGRY